jgi:fumarylpyruvate hydrolase
LATIEVRPPAALTMNTTKAGHYVGVHLIFCVGQNYAEHIAEMGGAQRKPADLFMKPNSAVVESGAIIPFPPATENLHHEVELVVILKSGGSYIKVSEALSHIYGYAVGNDLTRRDIQTGAKHKKSPWDMAKGFDNSAVIGTVHPVAEVGHPTAGTVQCSVDGEVRQRGNLTQ